MLHRHSQQTDGTDKEMELYDISTVFLSRPSIYLATESRYFAEEVSESGMIFTAPNMIYLAKPLG